MTPDTNIYIRSSIWRMFRDAADEDYLIARMTARAGLQFQYCWSSQQAIEKYLKAILLLNGQKINFNHDLLSMFGAVLEMTGDLIPIVLCPPNGFPRDVRLFHSPLFEPSCAYISRVEKLGNPGNRYRSDSIVLDFGDLNKLDHMCFMLRRVAFPLDMLVSGYNKTARVVLENQRSIQLHPKMGFQNDIHKRGKELIDEGFRWRNFAYFYEDAVTNGRICMGGSAINSEIHLNFNGGKERTQALDWLIDHALPKNMRTQLRKEIGKRRDDDQQA